MDDPTDYPWPSITCPVCRMTSYNPNDIVYGYCGNCHDYTSPQGIPEPLPPPPQKHSRLLRWLKYPFPKYGQHI